MPWLSLLVWGLGSAEKVRCNTLHALHIGSRPLSVMLVQVQLYYYYWTNAEICWFLVLQAGEEGYWHVR